MDEPRPKAGGTYTPKKNYIYDFMLFTFILLNDISKTHKSSRCTATWPSPHSPVPTLFPFSLSLSLSLSSIYTCTFIRVDRDVL